MQHPRDVSNKKCVQFSQMFDRYRGFSSMTNYPKSKAKCFWTEWNWYCSWFVWTVTIVALCQHLASEIHGEDMSSAIQNIWIKTSSLQRPHAICMKVFCHLSHLWVSFWEEAERWKRRALLCKAEFNLSNNLRREHLVELSSVNLLQLLNTVISTI